MTPERYRLVTQVFLAVNSVFWLPWGLLCLVWPQVWAGDVIPGMAVFDLSGAVARTEVRAMYGGLQMGIGVFALVGAFRSRHRESAFLFFLLALTGLVLCRLGGMIAEGESTWLSFSTAIAPGKYNQVGLAMYELPNCVLAWTLFLLRPRGAKRAPELVQVRQMPIAAIRASDLSLGTKGDR